MRREKGVYHKTFYCNEMKGLSDGECILEVFLLSDIQYCSNERGTKWLNVKLSDKTGSIGAKIWSEKIEMEHESFLGQIVIVSGSITFYAGRQELIIEKMLIAKENEYELSEVIKTLGKEKVHIYMEQIRTMIGNIQSQGLHDFVDSILTEDCLVQMSTMPVQIKGHHEYRGALLEHISEVVTGAYCFVKSTAVVRDIKVNLDLVIAGALLHDIAFLSKYKSEGYIFRKKEGMTFCDDNYLTYLVLEEAKKRCAMEEDLYHLLVHIVEASHHKGEPKTMEAMIVRSQNLLSAELEIYENECQKVDGSAEERIWSTELKRELYRIRR